MKTLSEQKLVLTRRILGTSNPSDSSYMGIHRVKGIEQSITLDGEIVFKTYAEIEFCNDQEDLIESFKTFLSKKESCLLSQELKSNHDDIGASCSQNS